MNGSGSSEFYSRFFFLSWVFGIQADPVPMCYSAPILEQLMIFWDPIIAKCRFFSYRVVMNVEIFSEGKTFISIMTRQKSFSVAYKYFLLWGKFIMNGGGLATGEVNSINFKPVGNIHYFMFICVILC